MIDSTRACVLHQAKDLRIETQPLGAPGPGEVLVRIGAGGICGSDLHYYLDGGFGAIRVREPMILGHEVAGTVEALGASVSGLAIGAVVALNPSHPCGMCEYCRAGVAQHCLDMRFWGSAMRMPHVQGGFRDRIVVGAKQCVPVSAQTSLGEAAMSEPLAVCLHAVRQAGAVKGKRVLVTGCGPIGALVVLAARDAGAAEIIVTDVVDPPLEFARRIGADRAVNVARDRDALAGEAKDKGRIDVAFECSGNPRALAQAIELTKPQGVIVQVGIGGTIEVPLNVLTAKELNLRGTFRFHEEFAQAAEAISTRRIDVRPLITATRPLDLAVEAFELAADKSRSMKVQLAFA
ncbi:L-idonate 5-dehydrogenase [Terrarubrum flagellatum]|uniref:L-idonate 5-dehydrogenase n=1 Tax=Terrirubrum flagellatum TaxID=2895980 RepID=UPI003144F07C